MMAGMTTDELLQRLDERMDAIERKQDMLLLCWRQRADTCPYRDRVIHNTAEVVKHDTRLATVERLVLDLRLASASGMVLGGSGALSGIGVILFAIGQKAGWW